jgi:hypothetical protein
MALRRSRSHEALVLPSLIVSILFLLIISTSPITVLVRVERVG